MDEKKFCFKKKKKIFLAAILLIFLVGCSYIDLKTSKCKSLKLTNNECSNLGKHTYELEYIKYNTCILTEKAIPGEYTKEVSIKFPFEKIFSWSHCTETSINRYECYGVTGRAQVEFLKDGFNLVNIDKYHDCVLEYKMKIIDN